MRRIDSCHLVSTESSLDALGSFSGETFHVICKTPSTQNLHVVAAFADLVQKRLPCWCVAVERVEHKSGTTLAKCERWKETPNKLVSGHAGAPL
jgi:hypothetical protein